MHLPSFLRRVVPARALFAGSVLVMLTAWVADAVGSGAPPVVSRVAVIAALLTGASWTVVGGWRLLRERPAAAWALLALLALSTAVKWSTLDFELITHARGDEGVYYEIAQAINAGDFLPKVFNYGHLLYYGGAVVLWVWELFPETVNQLAEWAWGVDTPFATSRALVRFLVASLSALIVIPVFWIGDRVGGTLAAVLGALLIACSTIHNEIGVEFISDAPSALFAALCLMFVARLLDGENLRDYLMAGAAAGLAAACKYPGGVVVAAIFGIWLFWRLRERRWSWALLWSALACVGAMLAVMPALWLTPGNVYGGDRDILFGFRQYAFGGWMGVVPESVTLWYLQRLRWEYGWAAIALGLGGWLLLDSRRRLRLAAMLPFPIAYLALLFAMNMVVRRNLLPVLPAIAALLGVGIAAWPDRLRLHGSPAWRPVLGTLLVAAAVAQPVTDLTALTVRRNRPSTGELAAAWIEENIPQGAAIVREDYTPALRRESYPWIHRRFAARMTVNEIRDPAWDYLLLSHSAYSRFLKPELWTQSHHRLFAERYEQMLGFDQVREFVPGRYRAGPLLKLFRLDPEKVRYRRQRQFLPREAAWLSDPALQSRKPDRLRYSRRWQYVLFKDYFAAGAYRARIATRPETAEGWLYIESRGGEEVGTLALGSALEFELPRRDKYFFKIFVAPRAELFGLVVEPRPENGDKGAAQSG